MRLCPSLVGEERLAQLLALRQAAERAWAGHGHVVRIGCRSFCESPSASGWLEELDRVTGRIVKEDLLAARTADHVAAEGHARAPQASDFGVDVVHQQVDAVP